MQEKVQSQEYVLTLHAEDEMVQDRLTIFDVENALLTGEIVRRQRDSYRGKWKYVVEGRTLGSEIAVVVTKLAFSRKLVIITVYVK
ncbi:DUF4258 domain-containing protein [Candidatus Poribacteria bacterium]|nr:DUF4258 domain-containing protein [Candidatus Poribacteria bacterium]MYA57605.1 DUF4258 domain-containing protein [Candidatus Poribacteria bacterium]